MCGVHFHIKCAAKVANRVKPGDGGGGGGGGGGDGGSGGSGSGDKCRCKSDPYPTRTAQIVRATNRANPAYLCTCILTLSMPVPTVTPIHTLHTPLRAPRIDPALNLIPLRIPPPTLRTPAQIMYTTTCANPAHQPYPASFAKSTVMDLWQAQRALQMMAILFQEPSMCATVRLLDAIAVLCTPPERFTFCTTVSNSCDIVARSIDGYFSSTCKPQRHVRRLHYWYSYAPAEGVGQSIIVEMLKSQGAQAVTNAQTEAHLQRAKAHSSKDSITTSVGTKDSHRAALDDLASRVRKEVTERWAQQHFIAAAAALQMRCKVVHVALLRRTPPPPPPPAVSLQRTFLPEVAVGAVGSADLDVASGQKLARCLLRGAEARVTAGGGSAGGDSGGDGGGGGRLRGSARELHALRKESASQLPLGSSRAALRGRHAQSGEGQQRRTAAVTAGLLSRDADWRGGAQAPAGSSSAAEIKSTASIGARSGHNSSNRSSAGGEVGGSSHSDGEKCFDAARGVHAVGGDGFAAAPVVRTPQLGGSRLSGDRGVHDDISMGVGAAPLLEQTATAF
ncbi:hypothetical protein JKP88DRAFT_255781 [Tribonema minus]|uniref:Uncharacterized protein n=1 Tax=Tribonema minus TaxID=303371 RepID=A0A835YXR0_9STRA|nr:hypothetical protein JKP88DRAFT_255781 [Tribonema minus]